MPESHSTPSPRVGIVGGGLAGLAAAVALVERGCQVELFEARRKLGGRAGSYVDQATGESIDHCQHVAMRCCTNYLDFCRRTGIDGLFERHRTLHFFGPDGRRCDFSSSTWLPAPLHLVGPLLALSYLSLADKLGIARAMLRLIATPASDSPECPTVLAWLREQRQSATAIERFWKVVLISALAESLDRASLMAARKVFVDGFLAHPDASDLLIPRVALDELYQRAATWLRERGVAIHLESAVASVIDGGLRVAGMHLQNDGEREFDFVILAVPWQRVGKLLPQSLLTKIDSDDRFTAIPSAPISSVHLWFDRPLTDLPHAVLVDRLSQWVFARSEQQTTGEHYYQVVISASHDLAGRQRQSVVDEVAGDLRAIFPQARDAALVRWRLITEQQAVFSVRPGLDLARPPQNTAIANLLLAGDWTRTGWPATMESAVRSGYLAAEAILAQLGREERIVVPDLPRGWLARVFRL
jgi:squalene-associated FAD-dependent desaturase